MTPPQSQYCDRCGEMQKDIKDLIKTTNKTHGYVEALAKLKNIEAKTDGNGGNLFEFKGRFLGADAKTILLTILSLISITGVIALKLGAI
jgi:hypothetical protein